MGNAADVTYIDLGPRNGSEINALLRSLRFLPCVRLQVHAVEADPDNIEKCRGFFANESRIKWHNFAIGASDTKAVDFYLEAKGAGSSIYGDKGNVERPIKVLQRRFSSWVESEGILPGTPASINIIKTNIEGAEWDLITDMDRHRLFEKFDIFCGPGPRANGWIGDIGKVPAIRHLQSTAESILIKHDVIIQEWHGDCQGMFDMRGAVVQLLRERGVNTPGEPIRKCLKDAVNYLDIKKQQIISRSVRPV